MLFSLQAKLIALVILATVLAGTHWKAYGTGYKAREVIALADDAKRVADALQAEIAARARESDLVKQVETVRGKYAQQVQAVRTVATAAGHGMRELQATIAAADAAGPNSCPTSGANGGARSQILRECTAALQEVAANADSLAARLVSLQDYVRSIAK